MKHALALLITLALASQNVAAQNAYTLQDFISSVQDDESADLTLWREQTEELAELSAHPIDINKATRDDLRRVPILSDSQIEDILTYVFLHSPLRSISELMAVESLPYDTRRALALFFTADDTNSAPQKDNSFRGRLARAKQEVLTRLDVPLYYREGYRHSTSNGGYYGSPLYNKLQYRLQGTDHLIAGFTAEKDQGEPFRGNKGWDHYAGYAALRNLGALRTLIVGDYKLSFGQGLVLNNGFSLGKAYSDVSSSGIRPNNGVDESAFFRGAALQISPKHFDISAWVSSHRIDATLNSDGEAKTIVTGGYHRTKNELLKKHNLRSFNTGADLTWHARGASIGATAYWQHFSRTLNPGTDTYRAYYPRGKDFAVASLHYAYSGRRLAFGGETAFSGERKGLATIEKLTWLATPSLRFTALGRYYQKEYYSFYANATCENSNVQNESGAMIKADAQILPGWSLLSYIDFFRNPWPRYRMTHSSSGQDFLILNQWRLSARHALALRWQLKRKETADEMQTNNRLRLTYTATPSALLRLQTVANLSNLRKETGISLSQGFRLQFADVARTRFPSARAKASVAGQLTYFHTPSYAARVYNTSEPSITSSYFNTALWGHGFRFVLASAFPLWPGRLSAEVRYACTLFTDRDQQGSGMQTIYSRSKNDLSIQLRVSI